MASRTPRKVGGVTESASSPPQLIVFLTRDYSGTAQVFVPRFHDEAVADIHSVTTYARSKTTPVNSAAAWCRYALGWPVRAESFKLISPGGDRGVKLPSLAVAALPGTDSNLPLALSEGHYGANTARFWWDLTDLLNPDHATLELMVWVQILWQHLNASR